MTQADAIKLALTFINAFAGVFVAFTGPELGALERLVCAGLVTGCGAALLFLDRVGGPKRKRIDFGAMTPAQRRRAAVELKDVMMETPAEADRG